MTNVSGRLHKMQVRHSPTIEYSLRLGAHSVPLNPLLGQELKLRFSGKITCIACDRQIKKTYNQGYCFPCMQKLAACDMCILKPETCHFEMGTCREPEWGLANCFIPHIVYLANSSGVKVGITRETQMPTRWIDQGAVQALPILRVQSRYQAGLLEQAIAALIADKTDWRKMLRGANGNEDLAAKRDEIFSQLSSNIQTIAGKFAFGDIEILTNEQLLNFNYPVLQYPEKVTSLSFDSSAEIAGKLNGIKGQYLIFAHGVINLRKFTGYEVEFF